MRWPPFYLAASLVVLACSQDNSTNLFLQGVLAPPDVAPSTGCIFTMDPSQPTLQMGVIDVEAIKSFSDTYQAVFLVGNTIAPVPCTGSSCFYGGRSIINGATVRITDAIGRQLADYTTTGAGFFNPPNGTTPGYGVVEFTIVDRPTVDALRARLAPFERTTIITYTQGHAELLGGEHVDSNAFEFPITVCRGCLVQFDTDPARGPQPNCFGPEATRTPPVCFYGQDVPIDCHECSSKDPFCLCGEASCM